MPKPKTPQLSSIHSSGNTGQPVPHLGDHLDAAPIERVNGSLPPGSKPVADEQPQKATVIGARG